MAAIETVRGASSAQQRYRWVWRWHFYAGLFVLPFILILSVTGSIYLFKPQVEQWKERAFSGLGTQGAVSPDRQVSAALTANPAMRFNHYRLPRQTGDAAMIQLLGRDAKPVKSMCRRRGRCSAISIPRGGSRRLSRGSTARC
ncbi:PepSY domain-containing protein [Sphingomonas sp. UYP23]